MNVRVNVASLGRPVATAMELSRVPTVGEFVRLVDESVDVGWRGSGAMGEVIGVLHQPRIVGIDAELVVRLLGPGELPKWWGE